MPSNEELNKMIDDVEDEHEEERDEEEREEAETEEAVDYTGKAFQGAKALVNNFMLSARDLGVPIIPHDSNIKKLMIASKDKLDYPTELTATTATAKGGIYRALEAGEQGVNVTLRGEHGYSVTFADRTEDPLEIIKVPSNKPKYSGNNAKQYNSAYTPNEILDSAVKIINDTYDNIELKVAAQGSLTIKPTMFANTKFSCSPSTVPFPMRTEVTDKKIISVSLGHYTFKNDEGFTVEDLVSALEISLPVKVSK